MKGKLNSQEIEQGRRLVKEARLNKYSELLESYKKVDLKLAKKDLIEEIRLDLGKIRKDNAGLTELELERIASEVLDKGWSKELEPSEDLHLIKGRDGQSRNLFIESKEKKSCCAWRKQYVYRLPIFVWEEFVKERRLLVELVGKFQALDFYDRWLIAFSDVDNRCWFCGYILFKLNQQNKEWFWKFNQNQKRKLPPITEKRGLIIKSVSDPDMSCCSLKIEKIEQLWPLIKIMDCPSSTSRERMQTFEEVCEIRENVKNVFLSHGMLKRAICQDCYDFIENLSVGIKMFMENYKSDLIEQLEKERGMLVRALEFQGKLKGKFTEEEINSFPLEAKLKIINMETGVQQDIIEIKKTIQALEDAINDINHE